jgi:hypothetical protein
MLGELGGDRFFGQTRSAIFMEKPWPLGRAWGICRIAESLRKTVRRNRVS